MKTSRTLPIRIHSVLIPFFVPLTIFATACANEDAEQEGQEEAEVVAPGGQQCSGASLFDPVTARCQPVADRVHDFHPTVRGQLGRALGPHRTAAPKSSLPVPGGFGAGVSYKSGQLQAKSSALLYAKMIVHPNGLGNFDSSFSSGDLVYITATNRTEQSVEMVAGYDDDGAWLGIFDWSCSPSYKCSNGATGASWIWFKDQLDVDPYITTETDYDGHQHSVVYYVNQTAKVDSQNPPTWNNVVWWWNYSYGRWDAVYSHSYRADLKDCSTQSCQVARYPKHAWPEDP